jgi:hypothetical protein
VPAPDPEPRDGTPVVHVNLRGRDYYQ